MKLVFNSKERELLERLDINALILFGSQAQRMAGPLSDFDIGALIKDKAALYFPEKRKQIYDTLYEILEKRIKRLVNIDIVFLEAAPYELRAHVMKHGKAVFEARPGAFADFKAAVMEQYADFAPLREIFHRGVLSQIK